MVHPARDRCRERAIGQEARQHEEQGRASRERRERVPDPLSGSERHPLAWKSPEVREDDRARRERSQALDASQTTPR